MNQVKLHKNSSFLRIDERVFLTMGIIGFLSVMTLAFRFKNYEPCQSIKIAVSASGFLTGYPIQFHAECKKGKQFEWDFGDGTLQETTVPSIIHIYKKPGNYIIGVTVNKRCTEAQKLFINEVPPIDPTSLLPMFISPDTALVNTPVTFHDNTPQAFSWEWRFGESAGVDATSREPTYIFKTSGIKTIYLKVNGRSDQITARIIYVKDAQWKQVVKSQASALVAAAEMPEIKDEPEAPALNQQPEEKAEAPKPKAPEITNEQMSAGLTDLVTGQKRAADFASYLCDNLNLMVVYNGNAMTFTEMCNEISQFKKVKKIQQPKVLLTKDGVTGCIITMNVTINKKSLFDKIF